MAAENAPAGALRVGIAGLGTVGVGVVRLLQENRDVLMQHCPRPIEVVAVSARDRRKSKSNAIPFATFGISASAKRTVHPRS